MSSRANRVAAWVTIFGLLFYAVTDPAVAAEKPSKGLAAAKRRVFEIRVRDASDRVVAGGSGFLCLTGGFGLTNYHVIDGAASLTATFPDKPDEEHPLKIWAVRQDQDLALVNIEDVDDADVRARGVVKWADRPDEGQDVYALGFPLGLGYSVTRGVVNGIRSLANLPAEVREKFPGVGTWVQTDCTVNHGNSGGPLINPAGDVIGINTFILLEGKNVYFAIAASEAQALLAKASDPQSFAGDAAAETNAGRKGESPTAKAKKKKDEPEPPDEPVFELSKDPSQHFWKLTSYLRGKPADIKRLLNAVPVEASQKAGESAKAADELAARVEDRREQLLVAIRASAEYKKLSAEIDKTTAELTAARTNNNAKKRADASARQLRLKGDLAILEKKANADSTLKSLELQHATEAKRTESIRASVQRGWRGVGNLSMRCKFP